MKRALQIGTTAAGKPFTLPLDVVAHTFAFIGIRGAGKTVAATVLAEEFCEAGLPWVAFDPTPGGVWWGLRVNPDGSPGGYPVLVIGGKHGDLPFHKDRAEQLAEAVVRENVCCVVDVHRESKTTWRAFIGAFCNRLLQLEAPTPRHLFIEEAPEFVPQRPMGEQKVSKAAVDSMVRMGRNAGWGATLLSQRMATIDKDVLTQCETLLAMRSIGEPDRRAAKHWIGECVSPKPDDPEVERFLGSLPELANGEGWIWSPQYLKVFDRVRIRERKTYHPGRTREVGGEATPPVQLSDVRDFVERFRSVLAEEPKALVQGTGRTVGKRGAKRAGRQLVPPGGRGVEAPPSPPLVSEGHVRALEEEAGRLRGHNADLHRQLGAAKATITTLRQALEPQYKAMQRLFQEIEAQTDGGGVVDLSVWEPWFAKLPGAPKKLLKTLLDRGGEATRQQVATLAGWGVKGTTLRDAISYLNTRGLIVKDADRLRVNQP